jgi:hypothetical protein
MPLYTNSAFQLPVLATKGVAVYLLGSFDYKIGNSRLFLTNSALTTNVATVTVQQIVGPLPVVGGLISIVNSTAGGGVLNVDRAIITAVNINTTTGAGTISFALTNANIAAVADGGTVIVEPGEVPEVLVNNSFSIATLIQAPEGDSQFTVPFSVTFPTLPTAATVSLQGALRDNNAEYVTLITAGAVAAGAQTFGPFGEATLQRGYLYRFAVTGLTGTGTVVAKLGN